VIDGHGGCSGFNSCYQLKGHWCTRDGGHVTADQPYYGPYCAGIGGPREDDPCPGGMANQQSTWGAIKSLFRQSPCGMSVAVI
jgi:hypothetical protein